LPGGGYYVGPGPEPNVGKRAPDLKLVGQDGRTVKLSEFRGRLVVLDIGGLTCGPCQRILPDLAAVEADFADKGVVVLSVFDNEKRGDFQGWLAKPGRPRLKYHIHPTEDGEDPAKGVRGQLDDWGGIPILYLIGPNGTFLYRHSGYDEVADKGLPGLRKAVRAAVDAPAGAPADGK
jgi:thiol-disulfide isomerase/thioredoxin